MTSRTDLCGGRPVTGGPTAIFCVNSIDNEYIYISEHNGNSPSVRNVLNRPCSYPPYQIISTLYIGKRRPIVITGSISNCDWEMRSRSKGFNFQSHPAHLQVTDH